jgi:C-terminal processing protease CtpA/Prc
MTRRLRILGLAALAMSVVTACTLVPAAPTPTISPEATSSLRPVEPAKDEPYVITGSIRYTSPFFLEGNAEPFVLLEDESGFVHRDKDFTFPLSGQTIGPVELVEDGLLQYTLPLPARPQGTLVDVDNNGRQDSGLMVFAIAYWSNTWGGPFLEPRDGRGWSNAYTSARTDPYRQDEIDGGTLLIWAPDDAQAFPTGFGPDGLLFTADDPTAAVPAGYSLVDLGANPFRVYREPEPDIELLEGVVAVTSLSSEEYTAAFEDLFTKVSREYPFTQDKGIDWDALHKEFSPRFQAANSYEAYYRSLKDFTLSIPDGHVGVSFDPDIFLADFGGSFGLVLAELSDGRVIAKEVIAQTSDGERTPAAEAGILAGAEILEWDGKPVAQALDAVVPYIGPHSTAHAERLMQLVFLTRNSVGTTVPVRYQSPGAAPEQAELTSIVDYDSLYAAFPEFGYDTLALPVEGRVLDDSGLGYIQVTTFSEDYNLMARLWEFHLKQLVDAGVPGLIIDVRNNGGGNGALATDFAGYFFDHSIDLSKELYYNETTGSFEEQGVPARLDPAPFQFDGPVAVLVSPNCASACEGFVHALTQEGRALVVGNVPTAGMYGEVGRGQYKMPGDLSLQFPTGRPETMDGKLLIEGVGMVPDIVVPVTYDSVMGSTDTVLQAAVQALLDRLGS